MRGDAMVSSVEIAAIALVLALAAWVVHRQNAGGIGWLLVAAIVGGTVCGAVSKHGTLAAHAESRAALLAEVPTLERKADGFVGSDTCRACHPREYSTWHDSFHRTMTQLATPEAVIGDFADGLAAPAQRAADAAKVRARWQPPQQPASELVLDEAEQRRRLGRRDDRPVELKE